MSTTNIALQLYTIREATAADMLGALRRVAEIGYPAVELAGYGGVPVEQIRATLDEHNVKAIASHVGFAQAETRLAEVIGELKTLGCEHAVIPMMSEEWRDVGRAPELGKLFNEWGARCREEGLRFSYHNHDMEFRPQGGAALFDALVAATDPALVDFEVDIGWVEFADVDAASVLRRLQGRVPLVHVKDMTAGPDRVDTPFGEGAINWDPILTACREAGVEWYIVEQDTPHDPMANVATSLRNLERVLG